MCVLLEQDPARKLYATGHHNIVNVPGTDEWIIAYHRFAYNPAGRWAGCVCSIESGPCERVESLQMSGRF